VEADKVSAAAREKIEKAGGTITPRLRDVRRVQSESAPVGDVDLTSNDARDKPSAGKASKAKTAKSKSRAKKKTSREN
jgi:hypothetical protein